MIKISLIFSFDTPERSRTYIYESGAELTFKNVTQLYVSENGTHYIDTESDGKFIVRCGWIAIELDIDEWTEPVEV